MVIYLKQLINDDLELSTMIISASENLCKCIYRPCDRELWPLNYLREEGYVSPRVFVCLLSVCLSTSRKNYSSEGYLLTTNSP